MNIIRHEYQNYKSNTEMDKYRITPNHLHEIITPVGAPLVGALKNTALNDNVIPDEKWGIQILRHPLWVP